jgi:hypothetical protein
MNQPKAPAAAASAGPPVPQEPPRTVVTAVRLMYAGAALTAIGVIISVIAIAGDASSLRASHPHASQAQIHATQNFLITTAIVSGLIEIGIWILMARMNRAGLKWARIAASVLLGLGTVNLISHIIGTGSATNLSYLGLTWLAGAGAVYFLWHRQSSGWFT